MEFYFVFSVGTLLVTQLSANYTYCFVLVKSDPVD